MTFLEMKLIERPQPQRWGVRYIDRRRGYTLSAVEDLRRGDSYACVQDRYAFGEFSMERLRIYLRDA